MYSYELKLGRCIVCGLTAESQCHTVVTTSHARNDLSDNNLLTARFLLSEYKDASYRGITIYSG